MAEQMASKEHLPKHRTEDSTSTPKKVLARVASSFKKKELLLLVGVVGAFMLLVIYTYLCFVRPATENLTVVDRIGSVELTVSDVWQYGDYKNNLELVTDRHRQSTSDILQNNQTLSQEIRTKKAFSAMSLIFSGSIEAQTNISIECMVFSLDDGALMARKEFALNTNLLEMSQTLDLEKEINGSGNGVRLELTFSGLRSDDSLAVYLSDSDQTPASVNGAEQVDSIRLSLLDTPRFLNGYFLALSVFLLLLIVVLFILVICRVAAHVIYPIAALGFGLMYMFVYPPYATPDENLHVAATYYYSSVLSGDASWQAEQEKQWDNRNEDMTDSFTVVDGFAVKASTLPKTSDYLELLTGLSNYQAQDFGESSASIRTIKENPYIYTPQILGVSLARLCHLGQIPTLMLGEFFNLLFYVMVAMFAIKITPYKSLFSVIGLMPFILRLSGSFNYDVTINALSMMLIAYILHLTFREESVRLRDMIILLVLCALLAPLKLAYFPILLLVLMIPKGQWQSNRRRFAFFALVVAVGVIAIMLSAPLEKVSSIVLSGDNVDNPTRGSTYSLGFVLAHPSLALRLLVESINNIFENGYPNIFGSFHGYGIDIPVWVSFSTIAVLFLCVFSVGSTDKATLSKRRKLLIAMICVAVYLLLLVGSLQATPVDRTFVDGFQDRYLIPVLPLLVLLAHAGLQRRRIKDSTLVYAMCLFNAYTVYSIFQTVVWHSIGAVG
jgi:uncharacterized membrane protein